MNHLPRAIAAGLLGALAAAFWLVLAYAIRPGLAIEMDRDLPAQVTGFHPVERYRSETFAWTTERATLALPGLDRRIAWVCTVRLRGARPDPSTLPAVALAVNGVTVAIHQTTNEFDDVQLVVPARPGSRDGIALSIQSSTTFTPGPHDPRTLGVMVDRLTVRPLEHVVALPPRGALAGAALGGAAFGAAFGLIGLLPVTAILAAALVGAGQAAALGQGFAPYSPHPQRAAWTAFWIALGLTIGVRVAERWRRQTLRNTARFAAAFSAGVLYLHLLVLLHPAKHVGDAMFHAHRFQAVLAGHFFFTSVAPGNYEFPYAIGLYLFAAPLAMLTGDFVALLRTSVAGANAAAGLLLYLLIVRAWGDRLAGAVAVALFHLVPIAFGVQATANLTNAFAQSVAIGAMASIAGAPLGRRSPGTMALTTALIAAAFLSHASTFAILFVAALATGALYRWAGDPALRSIGTAVLVSLAVATLIAVVSYYGRFGDIYRGQAARIAAEMAAPARDADGTRDPGSRDRSTETASPAPLRRSAAVRAAAVPMYLAAYFGWPFLVLSGVGTYRIVRTRARDRLSLALAGWGLACGLFLLIGILTPVDMRYYLAACPVLAIAAAAGACWGWRGGMGPRTIAIFLLAWVVTIGARQWIGAIG